MLTFTALKILNERMMPLRHYFQCHFIEKGHHTSNKEVRSTTDQRGVQLAPFITSDGQHGINIRNKLINDVFARNSQFNMLQVASAGVVGM